jgi:DNA-binding beta-propeller fold protein YncE
MLPLLILIATIGRFLAVSGFDYDIEGNLYVVDRESSMLVKYSPRGDSLVAVSGRGNDQLQFDNPVAVFARRGTDVYVADHVNHRIQRFDHNLDYVSTIYTRDDPDERNRFGYPRDVAVTRQGDVLVVDGENHRVLKVDALGRVDRSIGDVGNGAGRLVDPMSIEVDSRDNIYVLDQGRIALFDPFGSYLADVGLPLSSPATTFSIDGDTLVVADSSDFAIVDLAAPAVLAVDRLPAGHPSSMRLVHGVIVTAEATRLGVYRLEGTLGGSRREE